MAITTTGYTLKRYSDIIAEVRQDLLTASGNPNLEMSDDTILGIINNIYSLKLSELHELAQAQWSAGDPDTAEGLALDRIVARIRMTRLAEVKAYGDLYFTSSLGTTIASGTQVKDLAGNVVQTLTQLVLNTNNVNGVVFNVTAQNNTTYSIVLNGVTYSVVSDASATVSEIISLFITALSADTNYITSSVSNRLSIVNNTVSFNYSHSNGLAVHTVTKSVSGQALVANTEDYEADTLIYLVNPNPNISVTNKQQWVTGRALETDTELRERFRVSKSQGNATVEAIYAKLLSTEGVVSATVQHNWTLATDSNGLPPKSFECIVEGGSDLGVATTIWRSQPAGIEPFGNTSQSITDSQGTTQLIKFTRPVDRYIHVNVSYQIYSEEVFPSNGEALIAQAIVSYGNALGVGEDVIPQRIMAAIYNNVVGINNLLVTVGVTATPSGIPTLSTTVIPIGKKEESLFDLSRVSIAVV